MTKNILIIGGTGYIGHNLALKCISKNWNVFSLSINKPLRKRYIKKVKYIICDISKKNLIKKKIKNKFDFVVNCGGYVDHSKKKLTYDSHYLGCKNLVDFFLKKKLKKFIQIGSSLEYGRLKSPHKENFFIRKKNLKSTYSLSKYLATQYLINAYKNYKFPCIIFRLYLTYGPNQDENRLIPILIKNCIKGNKFKTTNGKQYRDFIYIEDVINIIIKAINSKKGSGEIYNLGTGKPIRVKKIIETVIKKIDFGKPQIGAIKIRKDEISKIYPSINKIQKDFNWKPKIKFFKGLNLTIKNFLNENKYK